MRSGLSFLKSCLTWLGIIFLFGGCFFSTTKYQFGTDYSPMYFAAAIPMLIVALFLALILPKPKRSTTIPNHYQARGQGTNYGPDDSYADGDDGSNRFEARRQKYFDEEERREEKERADREREAERDYEDRQQEERDRVQAENDAQWERDNQAWEQQEQARQQAQQEWEEQQSEYWENKRNEKYYEDEE